MWDFEGRWHLHCGDAIEHMATLPDAVFDAAIFSPPFPGMYAYTEFGADIGNSEDLSGDAKIHLSFFYRQFARLIKPGRVVIVHVAQIPRMKRAGGRGLNDFRGLNIRLAERAGLTFEYDWLVRKNPQAQAIRGKAWELKFQGVESDRSMSRGTLCDYLLKFRAPGENAVPIDSAGQVSRNDWIKWAEGAWFDIRENDTLNGEKGKERARSENDTKHICPLQLEVIDRLVRMYSNPGEIVFSPFAGIGSELVTALRLGRRAYGCELKPEYQRECERNCDAIVKAGTQLTLLDGFADLVADPVVPDVRHATDLTVTSEIPFPASELPIAGAKNWRDLPFTAAVYDESLGEELVTPIIEAGVKTCGELADRLLASERFGLMLADLEESLYPFIETMSEDDESPIDFDGYPLAPRLDLLGSHPRGISPDVFGPEPAIGPKANDQGEPYHAWYMTYAKSDGSTATCEYAAKTEKAARKKCMAKAGATRVIKSEGLTKSQFKKTHGRV